MHMGVKLWFTANQAKHVLPSLFPKSEWDKNKSPSLTDQLPSCKLTANDFTHLYFRGSNRYFVWRHLPPCPWWRDEQDVGIYPSQLGGILVRTFPR